jgi:Zn-dependent peptidase ImmA (M78 family)
MWNSQIEKKTLSILESLGISKIPIPVEEIAQKLGIEIKVYDLGEDISGVLVVDSGKGTIGINPLESKVRQRFSIAHELGHFEMHYQVKKQNSHLFIDKGFSVLFRDKNSSSGEIKQEQEANAFAASLLMPEHLLIKEIKTKKLDISKEQSLKELSKLFNVSLPAMTYRITNLNLF